LRHWGTSIQKDERTLFPLRTRTGDEDPPPRGSRGEDGNWTKKGEKNNTRRKVWQERT